MCGSGVREVRPAEEQNSSVAGQLDAGAARAVMVRTWPETLGVVVAAVAILAVATGAGTAASEGLDWYAGIGSAQAHAPGALQAYIALRLAVFLAAFQLSALVLTFAASRHFQGDRVAFMALRRPLSGFRDITRYAGLLMVMAAVYGGVVATIGAPVVEETVFRGLMYGVLRESPVGIFGAAGITALFWAALHAQYSVYGLIGIGLIGLYLAWAREQTGSLLTPIVCHAIYNGTIVVALMLLPERLLQLN
jgi:membrane protease YdiL (CAAX protease family)